MNGTDLVKIRNLLKGTKLVIEFFPPHLTLTMVELAIDCNCHAITSSYINNPVSANYQKGERDVALLRVDGRGDEKAARHYRLKTRPQT